VSPYGGARKPPTHRCPCGKGSKHTGTLPTARIEVEIDDLIFTLEHPNLVHPRPGEVNSRNWRPRMIKRLRSLREGK
jgi:hypothetical protein